MNYIIPKHTWVVVDHFAAYKEAKAWCRSPEAQGATLRVVEVLATVRWTNEARAQVAA